MVHEAGHETINFEGQEVKVRGHRRPELDLEAWRRHQFYSYAPAGYTYPRLHDGHYVFTLSVRLVPTSRAGRRPATLTVGQHTIGQHVISQIILYTCCCEGMTAGGLQLSSSHSALWFEKGDLLHFQTTPRNVA